MNCIEIPVRDHSRSSLGLTLQSSHDCQSRVDEELPENLLEHEEGEGASGEDVEASESKTEVLGDVKDNALFHLSHRCV